MQLFSKKDIIDNRYEVLFPIHETTYGQSYRVKDLNEGKLFMLKLYDKDKLSDFHYNEHKELVEADIHCRLSHENIVQFKECKNFLIANKEYSYYVVHFISGETLKERIDRDGIPSYLTCMNIFEKIGNAVTYLHNQSNPIIHADISPLNIILDYSNNTNPLLFDFGLSISGKSTNAKFNKSIPSVYFVSTEQLEGNISIQSDVFSLGAMLYYMLTGAFPWSEYLTNYDINNPSFLTELISSRNKTLNFSHSHNIDEQLKRCIIKSMLPDPSLRFKSIPDFLEAIKGKQQIETYELKINEQKQVYELKKGEGFKKIAGMTQLKEDITSEVIEPLLNPELIEAYGIEPPNAVLFFGPPGCGKTFFAECLAEEVGFNYVKIGPSDVGSTYVHGGQEKIKKLFDEAKANAPTILFLDEVDAMIPERGNNIGHHYETEVNEWLVQMNNCAKNKIFIIGATNRLNKIDKAVLRSGRFDRKVFIPIPDFELRKSLFKLEMSKREGVIEGLLDYDILANLTEGYVCSDINLICMDAARYGYKNKCKITHRIIEEIISNSSPSVSDNDLKQYTDQRNEEKRNLIGFNRNN
jgi:transitional endoplasmic reticulum ATPase